MKYEIIIQPEDGQHCGRCTYRDLLFCENYLLLHYCTLFDRGLNLGYDRPKRCGDCKLLTGRLMKMPELGEC